MPWNLSSCSDSSLKRGVSSASSSLIAPRRWSEVALMDSFLEKPSSDGVQPQTLHIRSGHHETEQLKAPPLNQLVPTEITAPSNGGVWGEVPLRESA